MLKTIIGDIEMAAKRIGRSCAEDAYKRQIADASLADETERLPFLQQLHEESDLPVELLTGLWNDERVKIKSIGTANFEERMAELKADGRNQLEFMWKTRVFVPAHIYGSALGNLEASPLKDQLHDLLQVHLAQDLIPNTLKRMRTKGLLRDTSSRKQVEKLETAIATPKKDVPLMKSLEKFHEKMGFSSLSSEDVGKAEIEQLSGMVKSMQEDTDGPRLFLTAILILLALRKEIGIVYATGKFAPRLLRLLKTCVDQELYTALEKLKDAVKGGSITDEDRKELRTIAGDALESATKNAIEEGNVGADAA